jgi:cytoskeletal protein RodZ
MPLVAVEDTPNPAIDRRVVVPQPNSNRSLLPIGALLGLLLGCLLFLVYFAMSRQTTQENTNISSSSSSAQQQEAVHPPQPAPRATANPSVEPSVEPSASPSESPSPQNSPTEVELSSSSISTAPKGTSDPVIIKLDSGVTIEADEAWKTAEGIWYRKHGVVSLLDPKNVIAIKKVSPAAPQPSAATTPSP